MNDIRINEKMHAVISMIHLGFNAKCKIVPVNIILLMELARTALQPVQSIMHFELKFPVSVKTISPAVPFTDALRVFTFIRCSIVLQNFS